jgi:hypothetical protein
MHETSYAATICRFTFAKKCRFKVTRYRRFSFIVQSSAKNPNPTDDESDSGAEKARAQTAVEPRDEGLGNLRDSLDGYSQGYHEGYYYVAFDAEGLENQTILSSIRNGIMPT